MISFGIMTIHNHQELEYFTEIAKYAHELGVIVYRFTPTSIKPTTELIDGYVFNDKHQAWEPSTFPIPQILYDRCFYQSDDISKKSMPIVNWLKNNPQTTFIGHGLPSKWHIYEVIAEHSILQHYLPMSKRVTCISDILKMLKKYKKVILKPENGSQGKGIITIVVLKEKFILKTERNRELITKQVSDKTEFIHLLNKLLKIQHYLIQPFLTLQDDDDCPFDLRILIQKDQNGCWIEQGRAIRKGQQGSIISNVSAGGKVISFKDWSHQTLSSLQRTILQDEVNTIVQYLPLLLEKKFSSLFELGIDIGLDQEDKIWILDINSKPGRKIVTQSNLAKHAELYKAPLLYGLYLAKMRSVK